MTAAIFCYAMCTWHIVGVTPLKFRQDISHQKAMPHCLHGNWTTRGLPTRGLDISRTGQLADWTTRGLADAAKKEN